MHTANIAQGFAVKRNYPSAVCCLLCPPLKVNTFPQIGAESTSLVSVVVFLFIYDSRHW